MAESKAPATSKQSEKQQKEQLQKFMATGLDFSPIELDAGDEVVWKFTPDPQPAETERLSKAMENLGGEGGKTVTEAFAELAEAIRERLTDEKQKKSFPLPVYGANALMWFGLHLATGRDGFPTE